MNKITFFFFFLLANLFAQEEYNFEINENLYGNWKVTDVTINGETHYEPGLNSNEIYKLNINNHFFSTDYTETCSYSSIHFHENNSFDFSLLLNDDSDADFFTFRVCLLNLIFDPTEEQYFFEYKVEQFFCTWLNCYTPENLNVVNYTYTINTFQGITTLTIVKENGDVLNAIMPSTENNELTTDWVLSETIVDGVSTTPNSETDPASAIFYFNENQLMMELSYCNECQFELEFTSDGEFIIEENLDCTLLICGENYLPIANIFENSFWQNIGSDHPYTYSITTENGVQTLTITNSDGDQIIMFRVLASNENFEIPTVALYPNPAQNELNFSSETSFENYQIVDLTGKILQNGSLNATQTISVQSLSKGLFFLLLENQNVKTTLKFVKE